MAEWRIIAPGLIESISENKEIQRLYRVDYISDVVRNVDVVYIRCSGPSESVAYHYANENRAKLEYEKIKELIIEARADLRSVTRRLLQATQDLEVALDAAEQQGD